MSSPDVKDAISCRDQLVQMTVDERRGTVDFLAALDDFDRRELYLDVGCVTLWNFCRDVLRFRQSAAYLRMSAMRIVRRFPSMIDALRDGRLSLSTVVDLGPVLTPENVDDMIAKAAWRSRAEVRRLLAPLKNTAAAGDYLKRAPRTTPEPTQDESDRQPKPPIPDEWLLRARLSERVKKKLERVRELAGDNLQGASWEAVLEIALDAYLAAHDAQTSRRDATKKKGHRLVDTRRSTPTPAEKEEASLRDGDGCTWRSPTGQVCRSTAGIKFCYVRSTDGGTVVRALCARHRLLMTATTPSLPARRKPNRSAGRKSGAAMELVANRKAHRKIQ